MRVGIPVRGGQIDLHFGRAEMFRIYFAENGVILRSLDMATGVTGHEEMTSFLKSAGVQLVICGGIGGGAIRALDEAGIMVMGGITGDPDQRMKEFLAGDLRYIPAEEAAHRCHEHHRVDACASCAEEDCGHCERGGEDCD